MYYMCYMYYMYIYTQLHIQVVLSCDVILWYGIVYCTIACMLCKIMLYCITLCYSIAHAGGGPVVVCGCCYRFHKVRIK